MPDPRVESIKIHNLQVLMFIALGTFVTGGQRFYDIEWFAESCQERLRENMDMTSVPRHNTFNHLFQAISPEHFGDCLINLISRLRQKISGDEVHLMARPTVRLGVTKAAACPC